MCNEMENRLSYYMNLGYKIEINRCEDGVYFAKVPDLPGCMTQADSEEEALQMIKDAQKGWLTVAINNSIHIPEPGEPSIDTLKSNKKSVDFKSIQHKVNQPSSAYALAA